MSNNNNPQYFDVEGFIDKAIESMNLGESDPKELDQIRDKIEVRLSDRIMATILNGFNEREVTLFESMLADHPELDELDVIMIISQQIDGMKEILEESINSLYEELVYESQQIDEIIKKRDTKQSNK